MNVILTGVKQKLSIVLICISLRFNIFHAYWPFFSSISWGLFLHFIRYFISSTSYSRLLIQSVSGWLLPWLSYGFCTNGYLTRSVISVVGRVHTWARVLMGFSPLVPCMEPSNTVKCCSVEASRSVPAWFLCVLWIRGLLSLAIGSYHQVLKSNNSSSLQCLGDYMGHCWPTTQNELTPTWPWFFLLNSL